MKGAFDDSPRFLGSLEGTRIPIARRIVLHFLSWFLEWIILFLSFESPDIDPLSAMRDFRFFTSLVSLVV